MKMFQSCSEDFKSVEIHDTSHYSEIKEEILTVSNPYNNPLL